MKTYDNWLEAKSQLEYWKGREEELRQKIAGPILEGKPTGTTTVKKAKYTVKAVKKVNYKLDRDLLSYTWDDLSPEEQAAIKFTPEVKLKEYKKLEDHELLDKCIEVVPAMPSLTITVAE